MMRCIAILVLGAAATGCSPPPPKEPVDLREARELLAKGLKPQAFERYANAYTDPNYAGRTDTLLRQGMSMILLELFQNGAPAFVAAAPPDIAESLRKRVPELRDPTGVDLLGKALEGFMHVLATTVEQPQHEVSAASVAWILRSKLENAALRRGGGGRKGFPELLQRRLLRECVAHYELFALVRAPAQSKRGPDRAAAALEELAADFAALAELPPTLPPAAAHWAARAKEAADAAKATRLRPGEVKLTSSIRATVDADVPAQLKLASEARDLAVRYSTGAEPLPLQVDAWETALRHIAPAREALAGDEDAFNTIKLALEKLEQLTQKAP